MNRIKTKKILFFIILVVLFMPSFKVKALESLYIMDNLTYLRSEPIDDDDYVIDTLLIGQNYEVISILPANDGCTTKWYQIKHNSNTGYVCGEHAQFHDLTYINEDDNFQATLDTFPKTYWPYLINLHNLYPNATFSPLNTNLDWDFSLGKQSGCTLGSNNYYSCKSLIQIKKTAISTWGLPYILNTNTNNSGGGCSSSYCWYAASNEVISTYMDPRNFLNSIFVFMFESNEYDNAVQSKEGLLDMLSGTFMDSTNVNYSIYKLENDASYGDTIMAAAISSGISPYALAARIKQEVGVSGSTIISGTVSGYEGYYNYYNINATGTDAIISGLTYAKNSLWNTRINSITGGAAWIGKYYEGTEYTQKWDVIGSNYTNYSDFFTTQYMQNIQAPAAQTKSIYKTYKARGSLDFPFSFSIPVYNDMPNSETEIQSSIEIAGYAYGNDYITNIKIGTSVGALISNIKESNDKLSITIKSSDGSTSLNDASKLLTGNIITISAEENTEIYRVVIKGDVNGDGLINSSDYVSVKKHIMEESLLVSYYKIAADIDQSNSIGSVDYINIKNYIMDGSSLIK